MSRSLPRSSTRGAIRALLSLWLVSSGLSYGDFGLFALGLATFGWAIWEGA